MTISEYMCVLSDLIGCQFELFGRPIATDKVFAEDGLLASFAKKAESLSTFVLNKPLGVSYQKAGGGLTGLKASFDESVPNSYRVLCMLDVLVETIHASPSIKKIKLDEFLYS